MDVNKELSHDWLRARSVNGSLRGLLPGRVVGAVVEEVEDAVELLLELLDGRERRDDAVALALAAQVVGQVGDLLGRLDGPVRVRVRQQEVELDGGLSGRGGPSVRFLLAFSCST